MCLGQSVKNLEQNIAVLDIHGNGQLNTTVSSLYLENGAILKGYECYQIMETTVGHKFLFTCEISISFSVTPPLESLEF